MPNSTDNESNEAITAEEQVTTSAEEAKILSDAVRSLPPIHIVKDLLSTGVCVRCILRLFRVSGRAYSCSLLSSSILSLLSETPDISNDLVVENGSKADEKSINQQFFPESDVELDPVFCIICLGILQFSYSEEKEKLVKKKHVSDFVASIAEAVKQEGHEISSFALEISLPPIILANERALWLYMKRQYSSELWFQEKCPSEHISLKDALKLSITSSLETLLGVHSGVGSFHIRLTYTHSKTLPEHPISVERGQDCKRRKTGTKMNSQTGIGTDNGSNGGDCSQINGIECSEHADLEVCAVAHGSLKGYKSPPEKVKEPCRLVVHCHRSPIYIGGRYLKYSRNVSQTRWIIDDERMGEASIEEIIGSNILPVCQGDNYKFHAAGREDIDVRMLGSGRPFLIEVQNARHVPSKASVTEMEDKINSSEVKLVMVKNLKVVGNQGWTLMREGEAEKQKQYAALVWISRPLEDEDLLTISSVKDMKILQGTPVRVLHRRSPLDREKIIHWMEVERISGSTQYFLLHLCTQAGTYIKEFVHGDLGRTQPSIGSILGCRAEILQLDVTDVKMDCFN